MVKGHRPYRYIRGAWRIRRGGGPLGLRQEHAASYAGRDLTVPTAARYSLKEGIYSG